MDNNNDNSNNNDNNDDDDDDDDDNQMYLIDCYLTWYSWKCAVTEGPIAHYGAYVAFPSRQFMLLLLLLLLFLTAT